MVEPTAQAISTVLARKQARQAHAGETVMSLGDHLNELRRRVIFALLGVLPIFILALVFGRSMVRALIHPMEEALRAEGQAPNLQAMGVFETFTTYVLVSVLATVILGMPWVIYQLWCFVAPGLYTHERRFAHLLMPMSLALTGIGVAFMYYVVLPVILAFMVNFTATLGTTERETAPLPAGVVLAHLPMLEADPPDPKPGEAWVIAPLRQMRLCIGVGESGPEVVQVDLVKPSGGIVQQPRLREYIDQLVTLSIAFAVAFQAPVVVLLLGWVGIVSVPWLSKYRRHAIMAIAAIAAVLTPPDPLSLFLLAGPLYILFEVGIVLLRIFPSPSALGGRREAKEGDVDDE
ncbi:MAG: preprotein translocase subunit TatC [Phycisphaeraceae bacterium]|nr:MAG: preprotein translocase subunit TatC [Phycisphaeraceae bacterium]